MGLIRALQVGEAANGLIAVTYREGAREFTMLLTDEEGQGLRAGLTGLLREREMRIADRLKADLRSKAHAFFEMGMGMWAQIQASRAAQASTPAGATIPSPPPPPSAEADEIAEFLRAQGFRPVSGKTLREVLGEIGIKPGPDVEGWAREKNGTPES